MKVRAILNPRAGLRARSAIDHMKQGHPSWRDLEVKLTERAGHARELAAEGAAQGCDLVVAVGGDGTANEVAAGLLGSNTTFGLVPMGSGNGLARTLRIPLRPDRALAVLADAVPRRMDVGFLGERLFLNVAGAGFDAAVGAAFHDPSQRGTRRGIWPYVRLGIGMALRYQAAHGVLEAGDFRFQGRVLIAAFVNGRQYGAGAKLAPGARLDDGLLDVVVVEDCSRLSMFLNAPRLFTGSIEAFGSYRRVRAARAVLTFDRPMDGHRDGEPEAPAARIEARVEPRALQVLVPRATAEDPTGPFGSDHP